MGGQEKEVNKSKVMKIDSKESWQNHIASATNQGFPVMVHFSACWCMPSVAMNAFFQQLASTYKHVVFLMVDVDELKEVAWKMEIKAMPTFVLVSGGVEVEKIVGANPHLIRKSLDAFLRNSTQSHHSLSD